MAALAVLVFAGVAAGAPMCDGLQDAGDAIAYGYGGVADAWDLALISPDSGWAVGAAMIARWDGAAWRRDMASANLGCFSGRHDTLTAVDFVDEGYGIAVGLEGVVFTYDGVWTRTASFTARDLRDVALSSRTEGWAVGNGIWHLVGGIWEEVQVQAPRWGLELHALTLEAPGAGYAVGQGVVMRLADGRWRVLSDLGSVNALALSSPYEAWAVGERGVILRESRGQWSRVTSPIARDLHAVSAIDEENAWAVGEFAVLRLDDGSWQLDTVLDAALFDVEMVTADSGWAVGERVGLEHRGLVLRRQGQGWETAYEEEAHHLELYQVAVGDGLSGWAVGEGGIILRLEGGAWSRVASPTTDPLFQLAFVSADLAWAAGDSALIQWDGLAWQQIELPDVVAESGRSISGMVLRERNDGWLVARSPGFDQPTLLRYDGSRWSVADTLPCSIGATRVFYSDRDPFVLWFADEVSAVYKRTTPPRSGLRFQRLYLPYASSGS